jgi:hypothetical protein
MNEPTHPGAAPALRLPRQAAPVHRGLPGGGLAFAGGVEADNIFEDIGSAFSSAVDWVEGAVDDIGQWMHDHPALVAALTPLVLAL